MDTMIFVLRVLNTPSLKRFAAEAIPDTTPSWPTDSFDRFQNRSKFKLQNLQIAYIPLSTSDITSILRAQTFLTSLTLSMRGEAQTQGIRTLIDLLSLQGTWHSASVQPVLRDLTSLSVKGLQGISPALVIAAITSRWHPTHGSSATPVRNFSGVSYLNDIQIVFSESELPLDVEQSIAYLQAAGLRIEVKCSPVPSVVVEEDSGEEW
jgi:hypothetical protein